MLVTLGSGHRWACKAPLEQIAVRESAVSFARTTSDGFQTPHPFARARRAPLCATMSVSQEEMDADNSLKKMNSNFGVRSYVIMNDAGAPSPCLFFERLRVVPCCVFSHAFPSVRTMLLAVLCQFSGIPLKYNGIENPAALQICALSSELLKKCGKFVKSHDEVCAGRLCRIPFICFVISSHPIKF
jgi:hypothetical protein